MNIRTAQNIENLIGKVINADGQNGEVELIDYMGTDFKITHSARVSYAGTLKTEKEEEALIRYLYRNKHTSPFEQVSLTFRIKCPIFVARQWIRHRTAKLNEVSARYTTLPHEMWSLKTERARSASKTNKQGSSDSQLEQAVFCTHQQNIANKCSYKAYEQLLELGLAPEVARTVLPVATYTEFVWTMDMHNLLHFLKLRLHKHAQEEIRVFAEAIYEVVCEGWPMTAKAFQDYALNELVLSATEVKVLAGDLPVSAIEGKTELMAFNEKAERLGITLKETI